MCSEIGKFRGTYLPDLDSKAIYKAGFSFPLSTLENKPAANLTWLHYEIIEPDT